MDTFLTINIHFSSVGVLQLQQVKWQVSVLVVPLWTAHTYWFGNALLLSILARFFMLQFSPAVLVDAVS